MMSKSLVDFWVYYYPQPWFRSPPYLVGIFLGWVLFYSSSSEKNQIQLPRVGTNHYLILCSENATEY